MKIYAKDTFRLSRLKGGYTIKDIAEAVGVTKQMIGQIERRENGIGPANAKKLTEVLNVEFEEIFEFVERN